MKKGEFYERSFIFCNLIFIYFVFNNYLMPCFTLYILLPHPVTAGKLVASVLHVCIERQRLVCADHTKLSIQVPVAWSNL